MNRRAAGIVAFAAAALLAGAGRAAAQQPTFANVSYGADPLETMDVYLVPSQYPTPVVVEVHPGGWATGGKSQFSYYVGAIDKLLQKGIAVVSINYPLTPQSLYPVQNLSCQRAVQFVRANAATWNLDRSRVAGLGISAGAHLALWTAMSVDAADPQSPDPVKHESSRLKAVVSIQGPTDFTDNYYHYDPVQFPGGSQVWQYFGVSTQQEYDQLPIETKQAASPRWLVANGADPSLNRNVAYLGVYSGLPTTQSSNLLPKPESDLHSLLYGLIQLEAMQQIGAVDASVYISPFVAPEINLLPPADLIASWLALRLSRANIHNSGFGVAGCIGTQFLIANGPAFIGNAQFAVITYDCFPSAPGVLWVSDLKDPVVGGTDYFGVGLPLLLSPLTPNVFGLEAWADPNGVTVTPLAVPNTPAIVGNTYYAQTAWLWPDPSILNGCQPSPLQISTTNLLEITVQ